MIQSCALVRGEADDVEVTAWFQHAFHAFERGAERHVMERGHAGDEVEALPIEFRGCEKVAHDRATVWRVGETSPSVRDRGRIGVDAGDAPRSWCELLE